MIDRNEMNKGWRYAGSNEGAQVADFIGHEYINEVANAIDELEYSINNYAGSGKGIPQLGGDIAEEWAAGTFNIRAVAAESANRAYANRSNEHASVDVSTNFGEEYSLKFLKNADLSVRAQAKNVIQNYHEYLSQAKSRGTKAPMSFEEYLARYNYSDDLEDLLSSVYRGQGRIIPTDQLEDGIQKLRRLIATESARGGAARLANLKNYVETLQALSDRIRDGQGIESIPLTKNESHAIAELCRSGEFDPQDFGISLNSEVTKEYILNQAIKGGITAALITLAIQLVPNILAFLSKLKKEKKIKANQLREFGLNSISSGAKGFVIGGLCCGIYTACKAGKLGAELSHIQPGVLGTIVALTFNVMQESFDYACGKLSKLEYKYRVIKDAVISAGSLASGAIAVAVLPIANALAFVIGSMVGSVTASVAASLSEKIYLSFCTTTGLTLFGIVRQDYTLSSDMLRGMGVSLVDLTRIKVNVATPSIVPLNKNCLSYAELNKVDVRILKRGIIAFHTIGYIL